MSTVAYAKVVETPNILFQGGWGWMSVNLKFSFDTVVYDSNGAILATEGEETCEEEIGIDEGGGGGGSEWYPGDGGGYYASPPIQWISSELYEEISGMSLQSYSSFGPGVFCLTSEECEAQLKEFGIKGYDTGITSGYGDIVYANVMCNGQVNTYLNDEVVDTHEYGLEHVEVKVEIPLEAYGQDNTLRQEVEVKCIAFARGKDGSFMKPFKDAYPTQYSMWQIKGTPYLDGVIFSTETAKYEFAKADAVCGEGVMTPV